VDVGVGIDGNKYETARSDENAVALHKNQGGGGGSLADEITIEIALKKGHRQKAYPRLSNLAGKNDETKTNLVKKRLARDLPWKAAATRNRRTSKKAARDRRVHNEAAPSAGSGISGPTRNDFHLKGPRDNHRGAHASR